MRSKTTRMTVAVALFGSAVALMGLYPRAAQAQSHACTAYEHRDYKGKAFGLAADGSVGKSHIANRISSFKMVRGCHVVAYEHDNFKGPNARWSRDVAFIGDNWNDLISSWKCVCGN